MAIWFQALLDLRQKLPVAVVGHYERLRLHSATCGAPVFEIHVDSPDVLTPQASPAQARRSNFPGDAHANRQGSGSPPAESPAHQRFENTPNHLPYLELETPGRASGSQNECQSVADLARTLVTRSRVVRPPGSGHSIVCPARSPRSAAPTGARIETSPSELASPGYTNRTS